MNANARIANVAVAHTLPVRIEQYDWSTLSKELDGHGCAVLPGLIGSEACAAIAAMYPDGRHFRSHVHMARHGFGKGEYKYFGYPLPDLIAGLRTALYPHLAAVANDWNGRMGVEWRHPVRHADFLETCHAADQTRPTPLLLRYVPGDYNCCTRTYTATSRSPCRSRSCCRSRARTSREASLSSPNSARACRAGPRLCR